LRSGIDTISSALVGLLITEIIAVLLCITMKKGLVGSEWGADHSAPFWSWRHFSYFLTQDCFFVWCRGRWRSAPGRSSRTPSCDGWDVGSAAGPS
jgi:hypothetical protein